MLGTVMAVALGATGEWTGSQTNDLDGVSCEYALPAGTFWRTFPGSNACPASATRPPVDLSQTWQRFELARIEAERPSGAWLVGPVFLIVLGPLIGLSGLFATGLDANGSNALSLGIGSCGVFALLSGIVMSVIISRFRDPYTARIEELEAHLEPQP